MNGKDILKIRVPELLFSKPSADIIRQEYKALAKEWHPDVSKQPDPDKVFSHISWLMEVALEKAKKGEWDIPGVKMFTAKDGLQYKINYRYRFAFEIGATYVSDTVIGFVVDEAHKSKFFNASRTLKNIKYKNSEMRTEFERFLPKVMHEIELNTGEWLMIVPKTPDVVPLRGLYEHFKPGLDPKHVAWVISSMFNLTCFLHYADIVHLNISLDTYYVSPEHHSGLLLGGWWYNMPTGSTIRHVPHTTYRKLTDAERTEKTALTKIDQNLAKAVGRELMGDYMSKKRHPKLTPMIEWLLMPSDPDPYKAFSGWDNVLTETFGKRRFIKLGVTPNDIYKTLGG